MPRPTAASPVATALVIVAFASLFAAAVARAADAPLPSPKERWLRVEGPSVTVYSDDDEATARRVALNFEALRAVVTRVTGMNARGARPTRVYVFAGERAFRPYREAAFGPGKDVAGFFFDTRDASLIALQSGARSDPYRTIYHEAMHELVTANYGDVPVWLGEGLAELYSTFRLDGGKAIVGLPVGEHIEWLEEAAWMSLPQLFAVDLASREYNENLRAGTLYAQSWGLVHFLMLGPPERRAQLPKFLDALRAGKPQDEAFRAAFATTHDRLVKEMREHLARPPYITFTLAELQLPEPRVTELAREDALAALGELVMHGGPQGAAYARAHFDAALAARPGHPAAEAGLGLLLEREGRREDAAARYRKAVAADPANELAQSRLGQLLVHLPAPSAAAGAVPPTIAEARGALQRAIALLPTRAASHQALGMSYLHTAEDPAPGVAALETALKLGAGEEAIYGLVVLYLRQGRRAEAQKLVDVLARSAGPDLLRHARQALVVDELRQADELTAQGKVTEAEALARSVLARIEDPQLRAKVEAELRQRAEIAEGNRWVREYNRAVALAKEGRLAEARAILVEVEKGAKDEGLLGMARQLIGQIDAATAGARP